MDSSTNVYALKIYMSRGIRPYLCHSEWTVTHNRHFLDYTRHYLLHHSVIRSILNRLFVLAKSGQPAHMLKYDLLGQLVARKADFAKRVYFRKFDDRDVRRQVTSLMVIDKNQFAKIWNILNGANDRRLMSIDNVIDLESLAHFGIRAFSVFNVHIDCPETSPVRGMHTLKDLHQVYDWFRFEQEVRISYLDESADFRATKNAVAGRWQALPFLRRPVVEWNDGRSLEMVTLDFVSDANQLFGTKLGYFQVHQKAMFDVFIGSALSAAFETVYPNPRDLSVLGVVRLQSDRLWLPDERGARRGFFLYLFQSYCEECLDRALNAMDPETFGIVSAYSDPIVAIIEVRSPNNQKRGLNNNKRVKICWQ